MRTAPGWAERSAGGSEPRHAAVTTAERRTAAWEGVPEPSHDRSARLPPPSGEPRTLRVCSRMQAPAELPVPAYEAVPGSPGRGPPDGLQPCGERGGLAEGAGAVGRWGRALPAPAFPGPGLHAGTERRVFVPG